MIRRFTPFDEGLITTSPPRRSRTDYLHPARWVRGPSGELNRDNIMRQVELDLLHSPSLSSHHGSQRSLMWAVPHTRQAPLLDQMLPAKMRPCYVGLLAGEGPLRPVAGSPCSGPSTACMGSPHVATIVCLGPVVDPNPDADGGVVHMSSRGNGPTVELKVSNSTFVPTLSPPPLNVDYPLAPRADLGPRSSHYGQVVRLDSNADGSPAAGVICLDSVLHVFPKMGRLLDLADMKNYDWVVRSNRPLTLLEAGYSQ
ncbi:hypothetical protein EI94DRAFT_1905864 [Lactarius quietus]|nr:hypothetical protein EI94DRAFT_1905864 [Lactarius quietus]